MISIMPLSNRTRENLRFGGYESVGSSEPGHRVSVIISIQKQVIGNYFTTHLGRLVLTKVFDLDCSRQVENMEASAIFLG
ncbi:MAG: hypothetical protein Ct9H300mP14_11740 [Gammaproteobacteria bacterium]|nr:MAG: hypothetical protein Ct9H300mP14_11740 [Gammaproteobacteria bacterium]